MNNQSSVSVSLKKDDFSIPVLDMNEWFHGSEEDKALFSSKWDAAFASSGFCSIVNHGVPRAVIDYAYNATRDFFDQPMSEKLKYRAKEFCGPGFREVRYYH